MNVILLIVAGLLGLLYIQAEINHRATQRNIVTVLHQITSYLPFVIATNTTVNEIQHDLLYVPDSPATLVSNAFDRHTESALNLVRGEN